MDNNNTTEPKKRPFGIERFYRKGFTLILGSILLIIPFYTGALNMLLLTDKPAEWSNLHTIFLCAGLVLFVGGLLLNRITEIIISVAEGIAHKYFKK